MTHEIAPEILEGYVKEAIRKWRTKEIDDPWLLSVNVIIRRGEPIPDAKDLEHKFNRFLNFVAAEMAVTYGDDLQRRFFRLLRKQEYLDLCHRLILEAMPTEEEPSNKKSQEAETENIQEFDTLNLEEYHNFEEEAGLDRATSAIEKRRVEFEKEKHAVLASIPDSVKDRFGQIYFGKWGKSYLPCLVLSPYSVGPGPVREQWFDMRAKVMKQKRLKYMSNLVYWYGASGDMDNAYSFLATSALIPYESGIKKKMDRLPAAVQKKIDEGKTLAPQHQQFVDGLKEMMQDLQKKAEERSGYVGQDFIEEWEPTDEYIEPIDQVILPVEAASKKSKGKEKKSKKLGNKKRKKEEAAESLEVQADDVPSKPKKKTKKSKKKTKANELSEYFNVAEDSGVAQVEDSTASAEANPVASATQQEQAAPRPDAEPDLDYKYAMGEIASEGEDG